jgi:hypothetical protein
MPADGRWDLTWRLKGLFCYGYKPRFFQEFIQRNHFYRGADKSLARPGRKQATATKDIDVHISYLLS